MLWLCECGLWFYNEIHSKYIIHNTPPARILFAITVDGKLKSRLGWPNNDNNAIMNVDDASLVTY